MKKPIIATLAVVFMVIVAVSAVQYISSAELFVLHDDLSFVTLRQSGGNNSNEYMYYGNASDSNTVVANLYVLAQRDPYNQIRVRIGIQHEGNTELDTVKLKFQSNDVGDVYFGGYAETTYSTSRVGQSFTALVTYNQALGQIEGSTPIEFIIMPKYNANETFSLYLQVDLNMHYKQLLELTQLTTSTGLNIDLH